MSPSRARPARLARLLAAALLGATAGAAAFRASETLPRDGRGRPGPAHRRGGGRRGAGRAIRRRGGRAPRPGPPRLPRLGRGDADRGLGRRAGRPGGHRVPRRPRRGGRPRGRDPAPGSTRPSRRGADTSTVPVRVELPVEPLAERLERLKEERDTAPRRRQARPRPRTPPRPTPPAATSTSTPPPRPIVDALAATAGQGPRSVVVPAFEIAPRASSEVVARDRHDSPVRLALRDAVRLPRRPGRPRAEHRAAPPSRWTGWS